MSAARRSLVFGIGLTAAAALAAGATALREWSPGPEPSAPPSRPSARATLAPLAEPFEVDVPLDPDALGAMAFPALGDLDGDGVPDLLVGGRKGRMAVYRNTGTADRPAFAPPTWFDEACPEGTLPLG